jgi:hypothetical protein
VVPILLGRVKEDEPREKDEAPGAERDNAPVEDEADVGEGADEQLGRGADEDVEREVEEAGTYKLEIQFVGGADLEIVALFPLLGLCGKIRATSPKFIESCDVWPEAPILSLNTENILCVETGLVERAVGKTLGFA